MLMNLIMQLVSGAIGGVGAGKVMPKFSLGTMGNVIAGIAGGGIGGQIISAITGASAGGAGMDVGSIVGNLASGGVGGGVVMVAIGMIKKMLKK